MHLTYCIQQLFLHVSFQICLVLKTVLQTRAINTRMGMIPIMTFSHHHNTTSGSAVVRLEWTQAVSCTEHQAGFMCCKCFDEVCFQRDIEPFSMLCINTRYLVLYLHRNQDKASLVRSVIAQCIHSLLVFFFPYGSKVQASLLQLVLTEGYRKGTKCKLFPMPPPLWFSPFPSLNLKDLFLSAKGDDC